MAKKKKSDDWEIEIPGEVILHVPESDGTTGKVRIPPELLAGWIGDGLDKAIKTMLPELKKRKKL